MSSADWITLGIALIFAIIAALMVAVETALASITPSRAEKLLGEGRRGAGRLKQIADDPAPATTASVLLRIGCEITTTVLIFRVIFDAFASWGARYAVAIVVMVIISFVAWGVAPRTLGNQHADAVALKSVGVLNIVSIILWPVSQLLILLANAVTPGHGYADGPFTIEAEKIADASDGEREMINSVFELGETIVREVMVPRTDIVYIEHDKTLRQGMSIGLRSGFSRIPVVDSSLDDVVGIVYLKDIMRRVYDNPQAEKTETISQIMRPASYTPDSKPVDALLKEMQVSRHHMVIVIDEFGGTAGLATIEDVVEEIVGEITDEYDADPNMAEQIDEDTWRISARMPVDDMGDLFGKELDDDDVETVGGLLAKVLNKVPIKGSQITWQGLEITAETATPRRHQIDTVLVRRVEEPGEAEDE